MVVHVLWEHGVEVRFLPLGPILLYYTKEEIGMIEYMVEFFRESQSVWIAIILTMIVSKVFFEEHIPFYGLMLMIWVLRILYDV